MVRLPNPGLRTAYQNDGPPRDGVKMSANLAICGSKRRIFLLLSVDMRGVLTESYRRNGAIHIRGGNPALNTSKFKLIVSVISLIAASSLALDATAQKKKKELIDKSQAKATATAPESTQVEKLTFPQDPGLPTYVVIIEPFDYSASGQTSGGGQVQPAGNGVSGEAYTVLENGNIKTNWSASQGPAIGNGIAKQLGSALGGWPNVVIAEPDAVKHQDDGTYKLKLQPGEVGPFIICGTITEFSETAAMEGKKKGFNSKGLGVGTAIIGGITGHHTVAAVGTGVAVAGPEYQKQEMNRTGMVGMDLRVLDGRIARAVPGGTFDCQGSFTSLAAGTNFGMLGFSSGQTASASSSLGQATRAAMNDALTKIKGALSNVKK